MTPSSKQEPTKSSPYVPRSLKEREEAFRLAAKLWRAIQQDLKDNPISEDERTEVEKE